MAGNTTTKKAYGNVKSPSAGHVMAPKSVSVQNHGGMYKGQLRGEGGMESYANPMQEEVAALKGIGGTYNDIGEMSGFITDGYQDKNGIPYGEAAKFNYLPPGMEITNQVNAEIHEMKLYKLTAESYPGDGWMPSPRDITE